MAEYYSAWQEMDHKLAMSEGRAECEDCPGCDGGDITGCDRADYFWCQCADCAFTREPQGDLLCARCGTIAWADMTQGHRPLGSGGTMIGGTDASPIVHCWDCVRAEREQRERGAELAREARAAGKPPLASAIAAAQSAADGFAANPSRVMTQAIADIERLAQHVEFRDRLLEWGERMGGPFGIPCGDTAKTCSAGMPDGGECGAPAEALSPAQRPVCPDHSGKWNTCWDCGSATFTGGASTSYGLAVRRGGPHHWRCGPCHQRAERERAARDARETVRT